MITFTNSFIFVSSLVFHGGDVRIRIVHLDRLKQLLSVIQIAESADLHLVPGVPLCGSGGWGLLDPRRAIDFMKIRELRDLVAGDTVLWIESAEEEYLEAGEADMTG